ncbi:MAG TPA: SRPBCC family protein [Gaiellaceae bacterium]|nr:SRPBCC family protein [Gaiellaceae bacterium]
MHRNEHSVEIDRPPEAVFPYLVEADKRLRWMGALKEAEQLTDGSPGLGTRFRDVFEDRGQRFEIDTEIVEWEPGERLGTRLRANAFESSGRQELERLDGRTRLTTTIETEYRSRMARLMAGVITRHAQTQLEQDHARLKTVLESQP